MTAAIGLQRSHPRWELMSWDVLGAERLRRQTKARLLFFGRAKIIPLVLPDEPLSRKFFEDRSRPVRVFAKHLSIHDPADFLAGKPHSGSLLEHSKDLDFHSRQGHQCDTQVPGSSQKSAAAQTGILEEQNCNACPALRLGDPRQRSSPRFQFLIDRTTGTFTFA